MKALLLAAAGLTALALSACASNKPVSTPNTALPAKFTQTGQADVALDHWWTVYDDPALTHMVEDALANAPDARLIQQRLLEVRATRKSQIYSAYPTGNLVGGATRGDSEQLTGGSIFSIPGGSTTYTGNFDVSWEADLFGRVRVARKAVDNNYAASRFDIEASRAALAANVADGLFNIRGLSQQLADAKDSQASSKSLNDSAVIRLQHGLGAKVDVDRTGADLAQANALVEQTQADLETAERSLLVLLGRPGDPVSTIPAEPLTYGPPPAPKSVPSQLLERRPDIRESEQDLYLAIAQLKIDRLALFPKFTILPGAGITDLQSVGITGLSPSGGLTIGPTTSVTGNWSIGGNISVPILNRPQLLAQTHVSNAKAEEAVINYEKTIQNAFGETDNLLVEYTADQNRLVILSSGAQQAESAYNSTKLLYDRGLTDLTTLLQAEQSWRAAKTAATQARTQALRRSVQAFKALGGGWNVPAGLPLPGPDDFKQASVKAADRQP